MWASYMLHKTERASKDEDNPYSDSTPWDDFRDCKKCIEHK